MNSTSIKIGVFAISLFLIQSCQKEEIPNPDVEYVKKIFQEKGIKNYKIDYTKLETEKFDIQKFNTFIEAKTLTPVKKNNLKIADLLAAVATAIGNFNFAKPIDTDNPSGSGYSCSASYGSETYGFYRGSSGVSLFNTSIGSTWTTVSYSYNSATNTYYFSGYDTYNYWILQWHSPEFEISVRRVGNMCYFSRQELF